MDQLSNADLVEVLEDELKDPAVQVELNRFYDEVYLEEDFLTGMEHLLLRDDLPEGSTSGGVTEKE